MSKPIQVRINTNTERKTVIVADDQTPKQVLKDNGIAFDTAVIHLDGTALTVTDMNSPFEKLGVTESAILAVVTKTVNAL